MNTNTIQTLKLFINRRLKDMYKFEFAEENKCLMLTLKGELIDYKFYNKFQLEIMSINEFLKTLKKDMEELATKNNIDNYLYNFLK